MKFKHRIGGLGGRLVFYYSFVVTATVACALILGFVWIQRNMVSGTDFLLDMELKEVQVMLRKIGRPYIGARIQETLHQHALLDAPVYYFQLHNDADEILFRSPNLGGRTLPDLTRGKSGMPPVRQSVRMNGLGLLRVAEYYEDGVHVQLATSLEFLTALSSRLTLFMAMGLPVVMIVSVLVGFALSEITLRPLRTIQQAAQRISVSNLKERIPVSNSKDELALLATLLNDMFSRLETSFKRIKEFTAEMSHELRTPLSIIRLHAEKAARGMETTSGAGVELRDLLEEVQRMDAVIDQLLILAKADAQVLPLRMSPRSTAQFIAQFAEDASALAEDQGKRFELARNDEFQVVFDAAWIRQVLFNLLSNALKFSPPGSVVRLDSSNQAGHWQVSMMDEGPGVPEAYREAIFEPFKQFPHPALETNGSGLGLAVCKSIVDQHGGSIHCRAPDPGRGFSITFSLPARSGPSGLPLAASSWNSPSPGSVDPGPTQ